MLQACLDATKLAEDALFRRVWRERVRAIALIIQRRVALAGLGGALRRAQPALRLHHRRCAALPALMAVTDHRSVASVIGYFQQGGAVNSPAARLLDAA